MSKEQGLVIDIFSILYEITLYKGKYTSVELVSFHEKENTHRSLIMTLSMHSVFQSANNKFEIIWIAFKKLLGK